MASPIRVVAMCFRRGMMCSENKIEGSAEYVDLAAQLKSRLGIGQYTGRPGGHADVIELQFETAIPDEIPAPAEGHGGLHGIRTQERVETGIQGERRLGEEGR